MSLCAKCVRDQKQVATTAVQMVGTAAMMVLAWNMTNSADILRHAALKNIAVTSVVLQIMAFPADHFARRIGTPAATVLSEAFARNPAPVVEIVFVVQTNNFAVLKISAAIMADPAAQRFQETVNVVRCMNTVVVTIVVPTQATVVVKPAATLKRSFAAMNSAADRAKHVVLP